MVVSSFLVEVRSSLFDSVRCGHPGVIPNGLSSLICESLWL